MSRQRRGKKSKKKSTNIPAEHSETQTLTVNDGATSKDTPSRNNIQNSTSNLIYSIESSKTFGRYLISKRNIEVGEEIMQEEPLVVGPVQQSELLCLGCHISIQDIDQSRCENCRWPICQRTCAGLYQNKCHTKQECEILSKIPFDLHLQDDRTNVYNFIVPLRCLLLKTTTVSEWNILIGMESHNTIRKHITNIWQLNEHTVVKKLRKYFDTDEIHTICGILEVNCFEVTKNDISLRALFPAAYLMSHNCVPNTIHTNDDKLTIKVRASVSISRGQPITTTYVYTLQGTMKRRAHLKETKFFDCTCDRCSDPIELGTNLSTVVCFYCNRPTLIPSTPLALDSSWISCNKKCIKKNIPDSFINELIEKYEGELKSIPENDIKSFEHWIKNASVKFHDNHYLILGVKYTLCLLYGKVPGFMIQEMNDDLLKRKIRLCEELLLIADVLEPGLSRLRGLLLYELHAPIMVSLERKKKTRNTSSVALKHSLKRVISCLEEAYSILKFEAESTMEGQIGKAAEQALIATHQWKKELRLGKLT